MLYKRKKSVSHLILVMLCMQPLAVFSAVSSDIPPVVIEQRVSATLQKIGSLTTPRLTSDYLMAAGCALLGAIIGHLTTAAVLTVLGEQRNVHFFDVRNYDKPDFIGTVGGATLFASGALCVSSLQFLAQQVNEPLLVIVLTKKGDALLNELGHFFVSHRFPRAAAFNELDVLRKNLIDILAKLERAKGTPDHEAIKPIIADMLTFLDNVRDAMVLVKNDPRWLEECNAATLALAQANLQAHQNAQLANNVIQLAHSGRR